MINDISYGLDITDKKDLVGICYTMWFNGIFGAGDEKMENARNVTEMTAKYGFSTEYGFGNEKEQHNAVTAFHYWGKPAQGYYKSTDKQATLNNLRLIAAAGVDFLILDYTFASPLWFKPESKDGKNFLFDPSILLLDTITEMRANGEKAPYVVYWFSNNGIFPLVYEHFYSVEKWKDCFVYWNGKPLSLGWSYNEDAVNAYSDRFTLRFMYGLQQKVFTNQWSYLEPDTTNTLSCDADGDPEHLSASVATQNTYMSLPTACGRDGGRFWNKQWKHIFDVHPKIATVTWWNEWCAQLYKVDGVGYIFTDNFNFEYSRDIEPVEGGHGDLYYRWLCEYVKAYKSHLPCPDCTVDNA